MRIGSVIAEIRRANNLSQESFGESLGVSRQAISKWEADQSVPEVEKLVLISKLYHVSVDRILGTQGETADGELTEAQVKLVEELSRRYASLLRASETTQSDPQPPQSDPQAPAQGNAAQSSQGNGQSSQGDAPAGKKSPLPVKMPTIALILLGIGQVLLCVWCIVLAVKYNRLANAEVALQGQLRTISGSISYRFSDMTVRMQELLKEQNSLLLDAGCEIVSYNLYENTAELAMYAIPRTWTELMAVSFTVTAGEETLRCDAVEDADHRFSATVTCPLSDNIRVAAALTEGETTQTQYVGERYGALSETLFLDVVPDGFYLWKNAVTDLARGVRLHSDSNRPLLLHCGEQTIEPVRVEYTVYKNGVQLWRADAETDGEGYLYADLTLQPPLPQEGDTLLFAAIITDNFGRRYTVPAHHSSLVVADGVFEISLSEGKSSADEIAMETGVRTE